MTSVHVRELIFHKIMNIVDKKNPGISEQELMNKTRDSINKRLERSLETFKEGVD